MRIMYTDWYIWTTTLYLELVSIAPSNNKRGSGGLKLREVSLAE